ncbi:hypothetical protein BU16DRAFT_537988 [Lophium mytilinum]|uniref:Uncharacterized protein n=1 Tax=Lophium mytilinum TaxID=390894 RepID=A0A6A6QXP9_9PEZI|nr:hypothetical protein BU16DRAFT_537988 [Lophium mytilinum]
MARNLKPRPPQPNPRTTSMFDYTYGSEYDPSLNDAPSPFWDGNSHIDFPESSTRKSTWGEIPSPADILGQPNPDNGLLLNHRTPDTALSRPRNLLNDPPHHRLAPYNGGLRVFGDLEPAHNDNNITEQSLMPSIQVENWRDDLASYDMWSFSGDFGIFNDRQLSTPSNEFGPIQDSLNFTTEFSHTTPTGSASMLGPNLDNAPSNEVTDQSPPHNFRETGHYTTFGSNHRYDDGSSAMRGPQQHHALLQAQASKRQAMNMYDVGPKGKVLDPWVGIIESKRNGLFFDSFAEADEFYTSSARWKPTLLKKALTTAERHGLVVRLREAILNMNGIMDNVNKCLQPWLDGQYTAVAAEHLAHHIVEALVALHTVGYTAPVLDPKKLIETKFQRELSFEQRLEKVEKLLSRHKFTCKALLDGGDFMQILAGPDLKMRLIGLNQAGNGRKQAKIAAFDATEGTGKKRKVVEQPIGESRTGFASEPYVLPVAKKRRAVVARSSEAAVRGSLVTSTSGAQEGLGLGGLQEASVTISTGLRSDVDTPAPTPSSINRPATTNASRDVLLDDSSEPRAEKPKPSIFSDKAQVGARTLSSRANKGGYETTRWRGWA